MITATCLASIIVEYNRYAYAVKTTSEKLLMRGKREINSRAYLRQEDQSYNEGSTTSFIIGVFTVNPKDNNIKYIKLDAPVAVKILSIEEISLPKKIQTKWKISVVTVYGNIFWEESYM